MMENGKMGKSKILNYIKLNFIILKTKIILKPFDFISLFSFIFVFIGKEEEYINTQMEVLMMESGKMTKSKLLI
jgi:hypothetical protein